jgi:iron complex outermembrane recepter protein
MRSSRVAAAILGSLLAVQPVIAAAQEAGNTAPTPATGSGELPPVDVIQKNATPAPAAQTQAAPKKKVAPVATAPAPVGPVAGETGEGGGGPLVQLSPLAGSEVPLAKVPRGVTTINASDISRDGSAMPQEILNSRVPSVVIDDLQGNQFQTGVQYRGFEATPVNGLPQGLAVYQNGVRINEAFGDTVNWDFMPTNAISGISVMGANPIYGLNAIGGAIGVTMKDGFTYQGFEVDTRAGSFGRRQGSFQAGAQSGNVAVYGAFEGIEDDGFRDFSDAEIRRGYADLGFKGDNAEFHLNYTGASNYVGVTAAVPEELIGFGGSSRTFTSPQTTFSDMQMFSANGVVDLSPTLSLSGVSYYRHFRQKHDDGNISEFEECEEVNNDNGTPIPDTPQDGLCTEEGEAIYEIGNIGTPIDLDPYDDEVLGSIDRTAQDAEGFGFALQAAERAKLFGLGNNLVVGASYDRGRVAYQASSELGTFLPKYVVDGTGLVLTGDGDEASEVTPRSLVTTNDYVGVYAVDALDLTDSLTLTVGGRFNYARVEIENTGDAALDDLNGINKFYRFNPSAGLTYDVLPGLSLFGGYAEANRAPTASEIACSDPENPCIIESALASDPPLKQVVSKTWEAGLRGSLATWKGTERLDWSLGVFHTTNEDDIIQIADSQQGRGYFANAGETERKGLEASVNYRTQSWMAYASYSYVDATFQTTNIIVNENNPNVDTLCEDLGIDADDDDGEPATCMVISPGNRMPGVPRHRFKAGFDIKLTPKWIIGTDLIAISDQIFYGDEANVDRPLPGYTRVNFHTSYNVTEHVQIYGLIENLFDQRYGVYGTYFNTELAQEAGPGENGTGGPDASLDGLEYDEDNARTSTPAIPFAVYGGVKVRY